MRARTEILVAALWLAGLMSACNKEHDPARGAVMKLGFTSTAFADGQPIPSRHIGNAENLSPALQWSGVPPAGKSLALICDDPDAPMGTWVHWVIYNLSPSTSGLPEGVAKTPELPDGARQGVNDFGRIGYDGPGPPPGKPHRYFFKLYALDSKPDLTPGATKKDLLKAIEGHVLAEGQLIGTFQNK
jgi:Raf kinase inhibitor-like YbhB/YbcL family protein